MSTTTVQQVVSPVDGSIFAEIPLPFCMVQVPDIPITGISIDSRLVKPGHLFVAMKGGAADGHDYIPNAIDNGAAVIVGEQDGGRVGDTPYIKLENPRRALTWIAASFYNWPGRKLTVIGVTGTDGKTTTTNLIHQILLAAGIPAGMISTVNAVIGERAMNETPW